MLLITRNKIKYLMQTYKTYLREPYHSKSVLPFLYKLDSANTCRLWCVYLHLPLFRDKTAPVIQG